MTNTLLLFSRNFTLSSLSYRLPKIYYANSSSNFNEKTIELTVEDLEEIQRRGFENWVPYCYEKVQSHTKIEKEQLQLKEWMI